MSQQTTPTPKKKVTFNVPEDLYWDYKKALAIKRTIPTADFLRHMMEVVESTKENESDSSCVEESVN